MAYAFEYSCPQAGGRGGGGWTLELDLEVSVDYNAHPGT